MSSAGKMKKEQLVARVERMVKEWPWSSADALFLAYGGDRGTDAPPAEMVSMDLIHQWLLNVEHTNSVIIVERSGTVTAVVRPKRVKHFQELAWDAVRTVTYDNPTAVEKVSEVLRGLPKKGEKLVIAAPAVTPSTTFDEEIRKHVAEADWIQVLDASPGFLQLLAQKDESEVQYVRKAALFCCLFMQDVFVSKWMDYLDAETKISHAAVVSELQEMTESDEFMTKQCAKLGIAGSEVEEVEVNELILQSGKRFELKPTALPTQDDLAMKGTYIIGMSATFNFYAAHLKRTFSVSPSMQIKKDYVFVRETVKRVIESMAVGVSCKDVYGKARAFLDKERPDLAPRFGRSVGCMTGLVQDFQRMLCADCDREIPANSVFQVSVTLEPTAEGEGPVWLEETVFLPSSGKAETFTVQCGSSPAECFYELDGEEPEPPAPSRAPPSARASPQRKRSRSRERAGKPAAKAPSKAKAKPEPKAEPKAKAPKAKAKGKSEPAPKPAQATMESYARQTRNKTPPEPKKPEPKQAKLPTRQPPKRQPVPAPATRSTRVAGRATPEPGVGPTARVQRATTQKAKEAFAEKAELERKQMELRHLKLEEMKKRFAEKGYDGFGGLATNGKRSLAECVAYTDPSLVPRGSRQPPPPVWIDRQAEALLVPYKGSTLIFHCKMIKNMSRNETDGAHFFRVNFFFPGQGKSTEDFPKIGDQTAYFKELLFKSQDPEKTAHFERCVQDFKEVQKSQKDGSIKAQHREEAQQAEAVPLRALQGAPCMRDISIKPSLRGSRAVGTLEAHANGFRFSIRGSAEKLEIPFSSIKTAIYQPAERGSLVVYIHIHLKEKKGIMVGRRATRDIQFYTEVRSQTEDLGKRRSANAHDPDEIFEEQRDEELKQRINEAFRNFALKVEKVKDFPLKFETCEEGPMCFTGVPYKAQVRIFLCNWTLVAIEDSPALVLDMRDVEIVVFERATTTALREFDMSLVMKNYNEPPIRITMIPHTSMVSIQSWLAELNMIWYTTMLNMQWQAVMRAVMNDIPAFLEQDGWTPWFNQQSSDEEDAAAKEESDWSEGEGDNDDDDEGDIEEDSSGEAAVEEEDDEGDFGGDEDEDCDYEDEDDEDDDDGLDMSEMEAEVESEDEPPRRGGRGAAKAPARKPRR